MNTNGLLEHPASRTLLITLRIRSQEDDLPDGMFKDPGARKAVEGLPPEVFSFPVNHMMRVGTAVRVRYFDDLTRSFLHDKENPVVVQLGCGLDTRFWRTDSGKGVQINMDLPEVIRLRQAFLPQTDERCLDWTGSILDRDWMHRLQQDYAGRNFLFIAEGVLMYLREAEVRSLLRDLADNFPGAHLAFDTAGSFVCKKMNKNSAVSKLNAEMTWGYDHDGSLDKWHPRLRRLDMAFYFNRFRQRWGLTCLLHYFPPLGRASLMHYFAFAG